MKSNPTFQDRMEKVWTSLFIPDGIKLDMAIKYSSDCYVDTLDEVCVEYFIASNTPRSKCNLLQSLQPKGDPFGIFHSTNVLSTKINWLELT